MTSGEETFALTQVSVMKRSSSTMPRETVPRIMKLPILSRGSQDRSPMRPATLVPNKVTNPGPKFATRTLLDSLNHDVITEIGQLSARPLELLAHMKKLEKTQAVQGQLSHLQVFSNQSQLLLRKREFNKLHSERKSKEKQLQRLKQDYDNSTVVGHTEIQAKEMYESLKIRVRKVVQDAENEEQYTKTLEMMESVRAKSLVASCLPLADMRVKVAHTTLQQTEKDLTITRHLKTAKELQEKQSQFLSLVKVQQHQRNQLLQEELMTARKRKEFDMCSQKYRSLSEATRKMEKNVRNVSKLEAEEQRVTDFEVVAEELQNHETYIARQEVNLAKLRKGTHISKIEETMTYFAYLKDTETGLNQLREQMMMQLARGHEEVETLTRALEEAAKSETEEAEHGSCVSLEQELFERQSHLEDLDAKVKSTQIRGRESVIASTCEIMTRLLRLLSTDPSEVSVVKSFGVLAALTQLETETLSLLSQIQAEPFSLTP